MYCLERSPVCAALTARSAAAAQFPMEGRHQRHRAPVLSGATGTSLAAREPSKSVGTAMRRVHAWGDPQALIALEPAESRPV